MMTTKKEEREMSKKYTLHYFDIVGRAESIRLTFAVAGIEFVDHRFVDRDEFKEMKASGKLFFGQVPALEVTTETDEGRKSVMLTQTAAIMRYVAKIKPETELYPSDPILAAKVDAVVDQRGDAYAGLGVAKYKERFGFGFLVDQPDLADKAIKAWNKEIMPKHLAHLVKLIQVGNTGWIAGTKKPSIADVLWAPDLKALSDGKASGDDTILQAFPVLTDYLKRFYSLPSVVNYYDGSVGCRLA